MISASRSQRVEAPRDLVFAQIGLTPEFFATLPVTDTRVTPDGQSATFTVRLGFGPVALKREGSVAIEAAERPERVVLTGRMKDDALDMRCEFDLSVGAEDETQLTYTAQGNMAHAMPRMGRFLNSILDDHVVDFVKQVAEAASRHWKAEQALGGR